MEATNSVYGVIYDDDRCILNMYTVHIKTRFCCPNHMLNHYLIRNAESRNDNLCSDRSHSNSSNSPCDVSTNELYSMITTASNKQNVHFTFGLVVK